MEREDSVGYLVSSPCPLHLSYTPNIPRPSSFLPHSFWRPIVTQRGPFLLPPPLWVAGFFLAGYALQAAVPLRLLPGDLHTIPAFFLTLGGLALFFASVRALRKAGTSPSPYAAPTALVTTGPYLRSRNPIYFAFLWIYVGLAAWVNAAWPVLLLPVLVIVLNRTVIAREEETLEARFGEAYRRYKAAVRRWA